MRPVLAALASVSVAAVPLTAAAQHHGGAGGGGHWSGGSHAGGGSWSGGGQAGAGSWGGGGWHGTGGSWSGGWRGGGFRDGHFHHFHGGFPVFFGGFGLGLALGSAWDPWWDYPYYGSAYTVVEHDDAYPPPGDGYYYDRYQRDYGAVSPTPPPSEAQTGPPPSGPCDKWQWDAARSQYYWIACPTPR